jgi:hypothetical protein
MSVDGTPQNGAVDDSQWWRDPESAWCLKTARAKQHIDNLSAEVAAFVQGGTYGVRAEPGDQPGETIYRLRMSRPIPAHLSTIIGDALHNLRSALDCVACELARRHVGRPLSEKEERACQFPISGDPDEVNDFFSDRRRAALYGARERQAIRDVRPGWLHDYVARHGQTDLSERDEEVAYDNLTLLNRLSNIDKHRRVHLVASWPDLVYWTSDSPARQRWRWGNPPFEDGAILGRLYDDPEHPEPAPTTLHHELELRVLDPPEAGVNDVVGLLQSIHRHLSARVIPGVLNPYWLDSEGKSAQRAYGG